MANKIVKKTRPTIISKKSGAISKKSGAKKPKTKVITKTLKIKPAAKSITPATSLSRKGIEAKKPTLIHKRVQTAEGWKRGLKKIFKKKTGAI